MASVVDMKAPQPRQMGREDRRVIFEKMNEVYVNERDGYSPPWTDAKVADDLGTPRDWVRQVREEMFGPEGANEDIRKLILDAGTLLTDVRALLASSTEAFSKQKQLGEKCVRIEREIEEIKKAVK